MCLKSDGFKLSARTLATRPIIRRKRQVQSAQVKQQQRNTWAQSTLQNVVYANIQQVFEINLHPRKEFVALRIWKPTHEGVVTPQTILPLIHSLGAPMYLYLKLDHIKHHKNERRAISFSKSKGFGIIVKLKGGKRLIE